MDVPLEASGQIARLIRAKKKIAAAGISFRLPDPKDLPQRLQDVLKVIYLIFNEGAYKPSDAGHALSSALVAS